MTTSQQCSAIFQSNVLRRRTVCLDHFEITLEIRNFPPASPGQFIQVLCHEPDLFRIESGNSRAMGLNPDTISENPLLRRPFSIGGMRQRNDLTEIDLMGRVVGIGTDWLNSRRAGDVVDLIGPLGTPFQLPPQGTRAIVVAGGVGFPPIRWLGMTLAEMGIETRAIIGAQRRDFLPVIIKDQIKTTPDFAEILADFDPFDVKAIVTTDDGSTGLKGRVTDALEPALKNELQLSSIHVFACGPEPMLKAVGEVCGKYGIACQLAMERVMGCGMGTCQSCVVPVKDDLAMDGWRYALCCREGPVFDSRAVMW